MDKEYIEDKSTAISFKIAGIDCAECSAQLEKSIQKLSGVKSAKINFATSTLALTIGTSTNPEYIKKQIESWGYAAEKSVASKTAVFIIKEMDCNDEVEMVNNKLAKLSGIIDFKINLMSQKLNVEYDTDKILADDIITALAQVKLTAVFVKGQKREAPRVWWKDLKIIFLALSGGITLLTFILLALGLPAEVGSVAYALAIIIGGYHPAKAGWAALKVYSLNINTLLVVAAIGAGILGLWEEGALLVFVFSLGSVLESYAVDKARGSIRALMRLAPGQALVKRDGHEVDVPVEEIRLDDIVIVKPGEKIPIDGIVAAGSSTVDQSPITGESIPISKKRGDEVYAAGVNQRGALEIKVTKLAKDSTLAKIIHLVEEAQTKKANYQRFGDKFGRLYTPIMFGLALSVALIPPLLFSRPLTPWLYRSLVVLVVSCSCGIVLSIPVAVLAAISNAARNGILVKGGIYLEALGSVKVIAFDKTGTLTIGRPQVTDIVSLNGCSEENILGIAAAIESRSEHPLAAAILESARKEKLSLLQVEDFKSITGLGAAAKVGGQSYKIGNRQFFNELNGSGIDDIAKLDELERQGKTTVILGNDREMLGLIAVADRLRPHISQTVAKLKGEGVGKVVMLTGDNKNTAAAIAAEADVDEYLAELLPDDKLEAIKKLKATYGRVAMIGDGINDAPAMAEADIGIAMGAGTDVALETGDLALMADELLKLPNALHLSRRMLKNIKQNLGASLIIIVFLVPAALLGKVGLVPGLLINEISSLIVIANGLRLIK